MSSEQHMGLLRKANLLTQKKGLAFTDFIQKYNIKRCAVFTRINNDYYITQSVGFDGISLCFSKSTSDFWTGIVPEKDKVYSFNTIQKTLSAILQFFSFKLKAEINFTDIIRTADNRILMLCNKALTEDIIKSFIEVDCKLEGAVDYSEQLNSMKPEQQLTKYSIDFNEAITSFIDENVTEMKDLYKKTLANEVQNRLCLNFNNPHFYKKEAESSAKLILSTLNELPDELVFKHIRKSFYEVLEKHAALIKVYSNGKCQSYAQVMNYFQD